MAILNSILGIIFVFLVAFLFSNNKKRINWRTIAVGFAIQFVFALIALKWNLGKKALSAISLGINDIIAYAKEGISFMFGSLANDGSIFAVNVLTVIIFISAIVSILYYLGIMQFIIKVIGGSLSKLLGTSKLETISASANIFLGQTESPLLIKPYIEKLSESELFCVMVGGLGSVSASILVGYSMLGIPIEYLVSASFMAAPSTLIISKLIYPESSDKEVLEKEVVLEKDTSENIIDAAAKGALDGVGLVINIIAILLAFVALIALINGIIGGIGGWFGYPDLSLQIILGYIFAPIAYILGVPWAEAITAGSLIGQKLALNEFVAYSSLGPIINTLTPKTVAIITFALCGFANISSIAILIGGIGGMAPSRKGDIARLGAKAILAGTLSNFLSAAIAGLLIGL